MDRFPPIRMTCALLAILVVVGPTFAQAPETSPAAEPIPPTATPQLPATNVAPPPETPGPETPAPNPPTPPPTTNAFDLINRSFGNGPRNGYQLIGFTSEPVKGQPTSLGEIQQRLAFGVPLWHAGADSVILSIKFGEEYFSGSAVLPDGNRPFPRDLWDAGIAAMYSHTFDNGWTAGGRLGVESPSDQPFSTWNETSIAFSGFLRMPAHNERDAWLFSLSYSPNNELNFPLPGVAYLYQPSDNLHITIGLPLAVMVRPIEDLKFEFTYVPVRNVHARATYRICEPLSAYVAFDWNSEAYYLTDRPDDRDRFYEYDKRLTLGLQTDLTNRWSIGVAGGYVFDRFFFEGENYSDRKFGQVDIGNGGFGELRVQYRFGR